MAKHAKPVKDTVFTKPADSAFTWSTATIGLSADTSPMELAELGQHTRRCAAERGALFPLKSAIEALGKVVEPRTMTIIFLFTLLSILARLIL